MKVVVAPDAFAGLLTAPQAAAAIKAGWAQAAPGDLLTTAACSDGGPGFLEVLIDALGGALLAVPVADPLGRLIQAEILIVERDGRRTAYVEAAQAAGLHLLAPTERDPRVTSSYGVGQLLIAARGAGVDEIVIGIGGVATTDAGAGALAALGLGDPAVLGAGGLNLARVRPHDVSRVSELAAQWAAVPLTIATDETTPLLGLTGTSATQAQGKGATPDGAQALEGALGHFADVVRRAAPGPVDLLSNAARRVDREPGAGAGGGLGYGLMVLGGRQRSAADLVVASVGLPLLVAGADLVVTGTRCLDWSNLHGSVVSAVAELALAAGTPTLAIAGTVLVGRREAMSVGLSGCYALLDPYDDDKELIRDPARVLRERAARVAATWSRGR